MGAELDPFADAPALWAAVAARLREHWEQGRAHLLTEDTARMATVLALQDAGVSPQRMMLEVLAPEIGGGKIDLVLGSTSETVVELKFPRDARSGMSPDTMTLGELIRDFLRVALLSAEQRWVVQIVNERLGRYLTGVAGRHDLRWVMTPRKVLQFTRPALEALPRTALGAIGATAWMLPVEAECVSAEQLPEGLLLCAYRVGAPPVTAVRAPLNADESVRNSGRLERNSASAPGTAREEAGHASRAPERARSGTARVEILAAIGALTQRSGGSDVSVAEVVDELRRRGSSYAESTVRTMMTSHMCADVHGPGIGSYDDLRRVGRGLYRLRRDAATEVSDADC